MGEDGSESAIEEEGGGRKDSCRCMVQVHTHIMFMSGPIYGRGGANSAPLTAKSDTDL